MGEGELRYVEELGVGTKASFGRYEVTREEGTELGRKYDPQPFHLSDEAAAQTHFGRLSASGWHTAAITMRLMVESGIHVSGGLIGAGCEVSWPMPTRPASVLHVEIEIIELRPSRSRPDRGMAMIRS